jgi:hypothetical protein
MLRSLLVGLIAISVAPACKSGSDAPVVQPGVTAGKVITVDGKVTATRGGAVRDLTVGSEVSGDDEIQTSQGASVSIWLAHNNATWTIGNGKGGKVGDSGAWVAAKVDHPPPGVDEATVAAGRHAEKSAADTTASAVPSSTDGAQRMDNARAADEAPATSAPTAPGSVPAPGSPGRGAASTVQGGEAPADKPAPQSGGKNGPATAIAPPRAIAPPPPATPPAAQTQPPAPPPPPPPPTVEPTEKTPQAVMRAPAKDVRKNDQAESPKAARAMDDVSSADEVVITIASLVPAQKTAMAKCITSPLKLTITVKAHVVTIVNQGEDQQMTTCLRAFAPKFTAAVDGTYNFTLTK